MRHKNGSYVWIWDHCVLVRDRSGVVTRAVGSVLDITERKEAEARLAASEHRFKAALLATTGIIWTHSPEGRAVGEQTSWSAFTGQSSDELAGMGWLDGHPSGGRRNHARGLARARSRPATRSRRCIACGATTACTALSRCAPCR